jgi:hypothetical protein
LSFVAAHCLRFGFGYGLRVETIFRLRIPPRGIISEIASGRETPRSTGATFICLEAGFSILADLFRIRFFAAPAFGRPHQSSLKPYPTHITISSSESTA